MHADHLKLFYPIKNILDVSILQCDLYALSDWCENNKLYLNIKKCKIVSFYRCKSAVMFEYQIDGICLERVVQIKDFDVLFDQKIRFIDHMEYIVSKSLAMLGFVFRICSDFDAINLMKILFVLILNILVLFGNPTILFTY